jgi:hypothetical protein
MSAVLVNELRRRLSALTMHVLSPNPPDFDQESVATIRAVGGFTMTSKERLFALIQAVRYVVAARIPGAFVECGVWRGGSMMAAARTLMQLSDLDRQLFLFDTFEGMSKPTQHDRDHSGRSASGRFNRSRTSDDTAAWCDASLADVQRNIHSVGYPGDRVRLVKGKVEDTLPGAAPEQIALLRLDTDWYESTRHELEHLYPRLTPGGVLIIDDYGHWEGCRKATDEYFARRGEAVLLARIDYTGRMAIKR